MCNLLFEGTVIQNEKALIIDCSSVSKLSWKFGIPAIYIYTLTVIYPQKYPSF